MNRIVETIPAALEGERLDRVVALVADVSRREAVALIADGGVTVDDETPAKPSHRLSEGDRLVIEVIERTDRPVADPTIGLVVVHEDEDVIVVDKPADLVVHPGAGNPDGTLVNGLLARYPELVGIGELARPGIVHRLDRQTSGLLMVARTDRAYHDLVAQLADRAVSRRYVALVDGIVEADEGLIDAPLGRSPRRATRRAVVADGRQARTRYRVERRHHRADRTLLACRLETGRTHQIRVHLAAIGHPVAGDVAYGGRPLPGSDRPFLHAAALAFRHPTTGRTVELASPLPGELVAALDRLDGPAGTDRDR